MLMKNKDCFKQVEEFIITICNICTNAIYERDADYIHYEFDKIFDNLRMDKVTELSIEFSKIKSYHCEVEEWIKKREGK